MKKSIKTIVLSLFTSLILLISPVAVYAETNYGDGSYGLGDYNVGEVASPTPTPTATSNSSSSSSNSSSSAPSCDKTKPGSAPLLWGATNKGVDSILLQFGAASDPVEYYALEFGVESGKYIWGATTIGGSGTREYEVKSLSPNTTYYLRIRAGNGCAAGDWSNEISAKTKGYVSLNQLEFTESEVVANEGTIEPSKNACEPYTVKSGDSLWKIAASELGDGNKYKEIIEQNKETYPSLATSNSLSAGWELQIDCATGEKAKTEEEVSKSEGLDVNVKVIDTKKQPVKGAKVTLHSEPKEATTDENGIAKFTGVESGEHKVLIAYGNYEGEQSIYLTATESQKEFNINITIEPKSVLFSTPVKVIIGVLALIIVILLILLLKAKKRNL